MAQALMLEKRQTLGLSRDEAYVIEAGVRESRRSYKSKLDYYEQRLVSKLQQQSPLSKETRFELQHLQQTLGLKPEDVTAIEARLTPRKIAEADHAFETLHTEAVLMNPEHVPNASPSQQTLTSQLVGHRLSSGSSEHVPPLPNPVQPEQSFVPGSANRLYGWIGTGIVACLAVAGLAFGYRTFTQQQTKQQVREQFEAAKAKAGSQDYEGCATQAQSILQNPDVQAEAQKLLNDCKTAQNDKSMFNEALALQKKKKNFQRQSTKPSKSRTLPALLLTKQSHWLKNWLNLCWTWLENIVGKMIWIVLFTWLRLFLPLAQPAVLLRN